MGTGADDDTGSGGWAAAGSDTAGIPELAAVLYGNGMGGGAALLAPGCGDGARPGAAATLDAAVGGAYAPPGAME